MPTLHLKKADLLPGLNAAAMYLLGTAADFEEIATRQQRFLDQEIKQHGQARVIGLIARQQEIADYRSKAQLLKGQAGHILELNNAG
jgi:hypothetical protein